jgi:hypothetical protein
MKNSFSTLVLIISILSSSLLIAQEDNSKSNLQTYTPSKLLSKGQWDIKWFNNLYTQTKEADGNGNSASVLRSNFFTSSIDAFTGITESKRINVGLIVEFRSNTNKGRNALSVFKFDGDKITARSGITSFAPAIKFQPFKNVSNFSVQTAFHIPLISEESNSNGVYLDQTAYTFQNRFFYDYNFSNSDFQLFAEVNTEYNFGEENSFANQTFVFAPGLFLSYFPSSEFTILGLLQHSQRFGDFTQDYTAVGFGGKYQLSKMINIETIYTNFVRGNNSGLGQTFNIGLRVLF